MESWESKQEQLEHQDMNFINCPPKNWLFKKISLLFSFFFFYGAFFISREKGIVGGIQVIKHLKNFFLAPLHTRYKCLGCIPLHPQNVNVWVLLPYKI